MDKHQKEVPRDSVVISKHHWLIIIVTELVQIIILDVDENWSSKVAIFLSEVYKVTSRDLIEVFEETEVETAIKQDDI